MRAQVFLSLALWAAGCGGGGGGAGVPDAGPAPDGGPLEGTVSADATWAGRVLLTGQVRIETAATVTIAPGTQVAFAEGAGLTVAGALVAEGAPGREVVFESATGGGPGSWAGLSVAEGASLTLRGFVIRQADIGVTTVAGALAFTLEDGVFEQDRSRHLWLSSDGSVTRTVFHGRGAGTPDGPLWITGGVISFTDVRGDQGSSGTDFFRIDYGTAHLDHATITSYHCAVHANGSLGFTAHAVDFRGNVYAFMFFDSVGATVSESNFDAGMAVGVYSGNAAIDARSNYWGGGGPSVEGQEADRFDSSGEASQPYPAGSSI